MSRIDGRDARCVYVAGPELQEGACTVWGCQQRQPPPGVGACAVAAGVSSGVWFDTKQVQHQGGFNGMRRVTLRTGLA